MTIKPLADRVVVKLLEAEEKTQSGIILTGTAKEKPQVAEIVAVGPGGIVEGSEVKMYDKVGDKVASETVTNVVLHKQNFFDAFIILRFMIPDPHHMCQCSAGSRHIKALGIYQVTMILPQVLRIGRAPIITPIDRPADGPVVFVQIDSLLRPRRNCQS